MTSEESRAEAEWRFPVTAYECPEDQATEVERFVAGAEWQAERDAERIAELEAEVERLNDALDAADVRYQMLGDWGERMKADAERVAELEAEVAELKAERDAWIVQADGAGKGVVALEAEVEEWRRVAVEQTRLERDRAEAAEAKLAAVRAEVALWNSISLDPAVDAILAVLDGSDET